MRSHRVVPREKLIAKRKFQSRRMASVTMSVLDVDLWFVQRDPVGHAITKSASHQGREFREPLGAVTIQPTPFCEQRRWEVPVKQRGVGRDASRDDLVDQSIVEVEPRFVHRTHTVRENPGPGDRQPVRLEPHRLHDGNVLGVPVIVVTGDGAGMALLDHSGRVAIVVPDRPASPSFEGRSFDLICRGRGAPQEVNREVHGKDLRARSHLGSPETPIQQHTKTP